MSFPSFAQGNEFQHKQDARIKRTNHRYKDRFTNGSSSYSSSSSSPYIEAFSGNSNGSTAPSTTTSASSSKVAPIPAEYQFKNIQRVNKSENENMKGVIKDVNKNVNTAVIAGENTSEVASNFLKSNDKNSLINSNITTVNGVKGAVNSMGIFSAYPSEVANNSNANFAPSDINIPKSLSLPINDINRYKIISSGEPNSANTAILGQASKMPTVTAQNNIGKYAGKNVYVYDRNPLLGNNISYYGDYNSPLSLGRNQITGGTNAIQCFERAADTAAIKGSGGIYAAVDNFGNCYTGDAPSGVWKQSYSKDLVLCEVFPGVTLTSSMILGANGGLYDGAPKEDDMTNSNLLNKDTLDKSVLADVDPIHGVTINSVSGSYGLSEGIENKDNMKFADSDINSTDPNTTGRATATLGTIQTFRSTERNCDFPGWMYNWWGSWARIIPSNIDYYCHTDEIINYSSILRNGQKSLNDVTITYKCGKIPKSLPSQMVAQGTQITISCQDEINKYGFMVLRIADNGVITITNSATNQPVWTFTPTSEQQNLLNQSLKLKNGNTINLNARRSDWVDKSGVTDMNTTPTLDLFTYMTGAGTAKMAYFSPGEYLSSPNGICRLKLNTDMKLVIEYSLYNLALDSSGYAAGNISNAESPSDESYAMYYIGGVQGNNIGNMSYVDMNNNVYWYPQAPAAIPLGESYTESKNYVPMTNTLSTTSGISDPEKCGNICSNTDGCGGFMLMGGDCMTYTSNNLFPNANRMYQEGVSTYIRDKKVTQDMTHPSCSKQISNVTTDIFNNFGSNITGQYMSTDKKCGMAVVLDDQVNNLNTTNANAIAKGKMIQDQITNVYQKQNRAIGDLQLNNMFSGIFEDVIQDVDKKMETAEMNALTNVAAKDNTELILISDNYKYIIWGIITLLLSIGAIKALRVGSS
jgi:hypothetical protein